MMPYAMTPTSRARILPCPTNANPVPTLNVSLITGKSGNCSGGGKGWESQP